MHGLGDLPVLKQAGLQRAFAEEVWIEETFLE
jgi:hypothetical protein